MRQAHHDQGGRKVRCEHHLIARVLKSRFSEHGQVFRMDWRPSTWHIDNAVRLAPDTLEEEHPQQGGAPDRERGF
jgi:hypothetical protein